MFIIFTQNGLAIINQDDLSHVVENIIQLNLMNITVVTIMQAILK
jgi:hypothetical protein